LTPIAQKRSFEFGRVRQRTGKRPFTGAMLRRSIQGWNLGHGGATFKCGFAAAIAGTIDK
jgi:hypothetical protein